MSLAKGVYIKDDCGGLKSKDSNHTRRSKQNAYHVVNKNIAPSKVTDGSRRKRGCLLGHPKLRLLVVLEFYLGVPWASPSLRSCHSLFHCPLSLYPKLENFTTQNSTENLMSSVSTRKQTTTLRYCNELIFIHIGVISTVFQLIYGSYPPILLGDSSK